MAAVVATISWLKHGSVAKSMRMWQVETRGGFFRGEIFCFATTCKVGCFHETCPFFVVFKSMCGLIHVWFLVICELWRFLVGEGLTLFQLGIGQCNMWPASMFTRNSMRESSKMVGRIELKWNFWRSIDLALWNSTFVRIFWNESPRFWNTCWLEIDSSRFCPFKYLIYGNDDPLGPEECYHSLIYCWWFWNPASTSWGW